MFSTKTLVLKVVPKVNLFFLYKRLSKNLYFSTKNYIINLKFKNSLLKNVVLK